MKKKKDSLKKCEDCIHEYACRMWVNGRYIADESASRCPNYTTAKESGAYLLGKMDGKKEVVKVETNFFDREETFENCTVQVLTNTKTGEVSVGWWQNDSEG